MLEREAITALIPHAGTMCLLDRVVECSAERIVLVTATHRSMQNPLRRGGRLRSLHLCEYGAQAMAVHGALEASAAGPVQALLVAVREVVLGCAFLEELPGLLQIEAQRLLADAASSQYRFAAYHAGELIGHGRLAAMAVRVG